MKLFKNIAHSLFSGALCVAANPAAADSKDCMCQSALIDAVYFANGSDGLRITNLDWDKANPGAATAIAKAWSMIGGWQTPTTLDVGVTEQRITYGTWLRPLSDTRFFLPSQDIYFFDTYLSHLFCGWSRPDDQLYEIGIALNNYREGPIVREVVAFIPREMSPELEELCIGASRGLNR